MNIWIVANGIAPEQVGGSETQTLGLATELAKRHSVTVLVRRSGDLPDRESRNGFLILRRGRKPGPASPRAPFTWDIVRELSRHRRSIDFILAKTIYCGWRVSVANVLLRIPAAVLIEGEREYRNRSLGNRIILRWAARTSRLLVQTAGIQTAVLAGAGVRAPVLPNGLSLPEERADGDKILYVGRLVRDRTNDKGVRYLIEAVRETRWETVIVGDGPELEDLRNLARGAPHISFAGRVSPSEVGRFLKQGRVLVVPSVFGEGLPNVILEAMARGLPVIAARTAGIPDIIEHGRTGLLVDPADAGQIRDSIALLRSRPALDRRIREQALEAARAFAWEAVAGTFEEIWADIARRKKGGGKTGEGRREGPGGRPGI